MCLLILSTYICPTCIYFVQIQIIPFIYVLMSNRQKQTYIAVYKYIHENLFGLQCKKIMSDFEIAMSTGFIVIIPEAKATHCHFRFCQAVKRNAKKCADLIKLIKEKEEPRRLYFKFLSLPLLPAAKIRAAFQDLKQQARNFGKPFMAKFLPYFERQYISGERVNRFEKNDQRTIFKQRLLKWFFLNNIISIFRKVQNQYRCSIYPIEQTTEWKGTTTRCH